MPQEEQNINKNELSYNNQEIKPEIPEWIKMLNKLLKENNNP